MDNPVPGISLSRLALALIPALVVLAITIRWMAGARTTLHALSRMLVQPYQFPSIVEVPFR